MKLVRLPVIANHFLLKQRLTAEKCGHQHTAGTELCPCSTFGKQQAEYKRGEQRGKRLVFVQEVAARKNQAERRRLSNQRVSVQFYVIT